MIKEPQFNIEFLKSNIYQMCGIVPLKPTLPVRTQTPWVPQAPQGLLAATGVHWEVSTFHHCAEFLNALRSVRKLNQHTDFGL